MTNQEITNRAHVLLSEEEEILIPVFKLYELLKDELDNLDLEVEDFSTVLKEDKRFMVLDSQSTMEPWNEDENEKMAEQGHYQGYRVMLKSRIPSKDEMMQVVTEKMQSTLESLKTAYNVNPDNFDDTEEEEFLQILKKTHDLQKKFDNINKKEE